MGKVLEYVRCLGLGNETASNLSFHGTEEYPKVFPGMRGLFSLCQGSEPKEGKGQGEKAGQLLTCSTYPTPLGPKGNNGLE